MANDVINPLQLFRDDKGVPLANGKLRIKVNRTNAIGTAFKDSALQIPQTVDPYVLDGFGRVTGDLRWLGARSVEVLTGNDAHVRTLNDVVTLVDTTGFARNYLDTVEMAADNTVDEGDVLETQSYSDANKPRFGGARYVATTSSETVDGYLVIDLAPAGLQARLLDVEQNNSPYVAGAVGDLIADDSGPVQALLDIGGDIDLSNGEFLCEALTLSESARLHGDGTLKAVQFTSSDLMTLTGIDKFITFDGITLDFDADNQLSTTTRASVRSNITRSGASAFSFVTFNNVTFANGGQNDVVCDGDDTANQVLYSFAQCRFLGGLESTDVPFLTNYITVANGANCSVEDCYFDLLTTPGLVGGRGGIVTTAASLVANPGYLQVTDCTFNRIGASADATNIFAAIHCSFIEKLILGDNRFLSPQGGAIAFTAEVDVVSIAENMVDGLTGTDKLGGITVLATAEAAPGANWAIESNELVNIVGKAILVDGASAGIDASNLSIVDNQIISPTDNAMLIENIDGLTIDGNLIDMALVSGIDAIKIESGGIGGTIGIQGNTILNCLGAAAIIDTVSLSGSYTVDGNTIEGTGGQAMDGISIDGPSEAFITNNQMADIEGDLIILDNLSTARVDGNSYTGGSDPANWLQAPTITDLLIGENSWKQVADEVFQKTAAGAVLNITGPYLAILDTTTITSAVFVADIIGFTLVIKAQASVTINDSVTMNLAGNFNMLDGNTLVLTWGGAAFNEISRSVN